MKNKVKMIAIQLLLVFGFLFLSFSLFLIFNRLHIDLFGVLSAEKAIFINGYTTSKSVLKNTYILHSALLCFLMIYGAWSIFKNYFLPLFQKAYKINKQIILKVLMIIIPLSIFMLGLWYAESYLSHLGYVAGGNFGGCNFSIENPKISWELIADERGMAYYDCDSIVKIQKRLGFVVNQEGFPNPFNFDRKTLDSLSSKSLPRKKKKMFLGDSFLEGLGASNHDSCFIELYRKQHPEEVVCSFGIGGNDPIQYRLLAEKYITQLSPHEVTILFCGWNDLILLNRKPRPFLPPLAYIEGVGYIYNYIFTGLTPFDTLALQPDSAYRLYRQKYSLFVKNDWLSVIARQSIITSQIYFQFNPVKEYPNQFAEDSSAVYRNLIRIKELCDSVDTKFSIVFIPTPLMKDFSEKDYEKNYQWAFRELWSSVHLCPKGYIQESDCCTANDFHFNNKGQVKFAKFLNETVK